MANASDSGTGCVERIRTLVVAGDLSSGTGLPAGCRGADARAVLGEDGEAGSGELSSSIRSWVKYRFGDGSIARVWLAEHDAILLIDIDHPPVREHPDALQARLGAPATTGRGRKDPTAEEWIYPDRGLTITVEGKYETPPQLRVSYLFVYAPTTLDDYFGRLGGKDEWIRRRPQRR